MDFEPTEKQEHLFNAALSRDYDIILYGGAVRGGKTYGSLHLFIYLALYYPDSRWVVIRNTLQDLKNSAISILKKIVRNKSFCKYNNQDHELVFSNGSVIKLMGANEERDRSFERFNGIEYNGVLFEEVTSISEAAFNAAIVRAGSWAEAEKKPDIITGELKHPPKLIICTCNPSGNWVKEKLYLPSLGEISEEEINKMNKNGEKKILFISAKIDDNKHNADSYDKENLKKILTERDYKVKVEGRWDVVLKPMDSLWIDFKHEEHIGNCDIDFNDQILVSIDENVLPYITLSLWQIDINGKSIKQVYEIPCKYPDNTAMKSAKKLSRYIKEINFKRPVVFYADSSTTNRSTLIDSTFFDLFVETFEKDCENTIYKRPLMSNPSIIESAEFINDLYCGWNGWRILIDDSCKNSIEDYTLCKRDKDGKTLKERGRTIDGISYELRGHFSDTKRYVIHEHLKNTSFQEWRNRFNILELNSNFEDIDFC